MATSVGRCMAAAGSVRVSPTLASFAMCLPAGAVAQVPAPPTVQL